MKAEAAALSFRAQRCLYHYFSSTPLILKDALLVFPEALSLNFLVGNTENHDKVALRNYVDKIQQDTTVCGYLFTANILYIFRVSIAPIISSTGNCNFSLWYRSYYVIISPRWKKVDALLRNMTCTSGCSYILTYS